MRMTLITLLLAVSLTTFCTLPVFCSSDECTVLQNYTVSSQNGSNVTSCYSSPQGTPCATLDYLIEHLFGIKSNCVNVEILDNQTVSGALLFPHVSQVSLVGVAEGRIHIRCEVDSGLVFDHSRQVHLENLHFVGCLLDVTDRLSTEARSVMSPNVVTSILFAGGSDLEVVQCAFVGHALVLVDILGSILIKDSVFNGTENPVNKNMTRTGGMIIRRFPSVPGNCSYIITNCSFSDNVALHNSKDCPRDDVLDYTEGGGAIEFNLTTPRDSSADIVIRESKFHQNRAETGGAIGMFFSGENSAFSFHLANTNFVRNQACNTGGAIIMKPLITGKGVPANGSLWMEQCNFINNSAFWGGGLSVDVCEECGFVTVFANLSNWIENNAYTSGFGAGLYSTHTSCDSAEPTEYKVKAQFLECMFLENTNYGVYDNLNAMGALSVTASEVKILDSCVFNSNQGTALLLKNQSKAIFSGDIGFRYNFGIKGAAIHLDNGAHVEINASSTVTFERNIALVKGGAVYSTPIKNLHEQHIPCLFSVVDPGDVTVRFIDNKASNVDQSVFVGNPQQCNLTTLKKVFTYSPAINNQIVTIPHDVSLKTIPESKSDTLEVMLGERFYLNPTVNDSFGHSTTSSGSVALLSCDSSTLTYANKTILIGPSSIYLDNYTSNNEFYLRGPEDEVGKCFVLEYIYDQYYTYRSSNAQIRVELVPCKLGYVYSNRTQQCECVDQRNALCPFSNRTLFCLQLGYWYDSTSHMAIPCPNQNCKFNGGKCLKSECLNSSGYCIIEEEDDVCWGGRSKKLCSQCKANFSFTFGAYKCVPSDTCNRLSTFLNVLVMMAYWIVSIVVVLFVLTLNLSVGSGFMYGLVYYFSVVKLFTNDTLELFFLKQIVDICVSFTQLDPVGFEALIPFCFIQSWDNSLPHLMFRYVTPVFVIVVISAIIWFSRNCRCPRALSLAENSPIHAICMLVLFSYTSLSFTSFKILHPIDIEGELYVLAYPDVKYFKGYHLPFALFALFVECFISLPICFLLLFAPCLSKRVNLVRLRLMPILDEFQACYRPECRWFAGFYFLARQLMYLASIIPQPDVSQANLLLHTLSFVFLFIHTTFQPYRKRWLNVLDTVLLLDLVLLSLYSKVNRGHQFSSLNKVLFDAAPYVYILVPAGCLFCVLSGLLLKRFHHCFGRSNFYKAKTKSLQMRRQVSSPPTCTTVSIGDEESVNRPLVGSFYQDNGEREPLLAGNDSEDTGASSRSSITQTVLNRFTGRNKASTT